MPSHSLPGHRRPSPLLWRVSTLTAFRWLLSVHSRYGPHNPLTPEEVVSGRDSALLLPPGPLLSFQSERELAGADFHRRKDRHFKAHTTISASVLSVRSLWEKGLVVRWFTDGREPRGTDNGLLGTAVWSHMLG